MTTLEAKLTEANRWLAHKKALAFLGDHYLLAAPVPRLSIKPKQRLILWQTEPGNEQRLLSDERRVEADTLTSA